MEGRVKTRLAESIGTAKATELYAAFVRDSAGLAWTCCKRVVWAYTPDDRSVFEWFIALAGNDAGVWPQPAGSLGDRLSAFFHEQFRAGCNRVVVIGSDSPTLPREYVTRAFSLLDTHEVVLGPATDGGYYLMGLSQAGLRSQSEPHPPHPSCCEAAGVLADSWTDPLFHDISWSGPDVLTESIARVRRAGRSLALLPSWYDVDTLDDLRLLQRHLAALAEAGITDVGWETQNVLSRLEC